MTSNKNAPFFIGYRPFPAALTRWYLALAAVFVLASGVGGYWLAAQQAAPAPGNWDSAATTTMRGILMLRPYPALHRLNPAAPGGVESVLLVRQGKHSADAWARGFDRQAVSARGYAITRGGWKMLEIPGADALAVDAGGDGDGDGDLETLRALLEIQPLGPAELAGEIVDSKCFLGVMKPGHGMTHKACAELCLRGGIPPILVAADADGRKIGTLLARADGGSAAAELAQFAADPVRVSGRLQRQGGLLFMRVDAGGVQRR